MPAEAPNLLAEIQKYGLGVAAAAVAFKGLDVIKFLLGMLKKRRDSEDGERPVERRSGNAELMDAAKRGLEAAQLAKDAAFDATKACAETNSAMEKIESIVGRTHERTNRIMDIQHELASSLKDMAHGMDSLTKLSEESRNILLGMSKDLAVTMAKIQQLFESKGQ
jgi:hypothetical protein